jgi:hypothetical protein
LREKFTITTTKPNPIATGEMEIIVSKEVLH